MTLHRWRWAWCAAAVLLLGGCNSKSGEEAGKEIGQQVDRAVQKGREQARELSDDLRQGWERVQAGVETMGVRGRVYARLHWDKTLSAAAISIEATEDGVVTLRGGVPTAAAQTRAVDLARETVGVKRVVDELNVEPRTDAR